MTQATDPTQPNTTWWWLSFADPALPAGQQFLGIAIVRAPDPATAAQAAAAQGINPGGEVVALPLPPDTEPAGGYANRLFTGDEAKALSATEPPVWLRDSPGFATVEVRVIRPGQRTAVATFHKVENFNMTNKPEYDQEPDVSFMLAPGLPATMAGHAQLRAVRFEITGRAVPNYAGTIRRMELLHDPNPPAGGDAATAPDRAADRPITVEQIDDMELLARSSNNLLALGLIAELRQLHQRVEAGLQWCDRADPNPESNGDVLREIREILTGTGPDHG